jgi:hypothetical protein
MTKFNFNGKIQWQNSISMAMAISIKMVKIKKAENVLTK